MKMKLIVVGILLLGVSTIGEARRFSARDRALGRFFSQPTPRPRTNVTPADGDTVILFNKRGESSANAVSFSFACDRAYGKANAVVAQYRNQCKALKGRFTSTTGKCFDPWPFNPNSLAKSGYVRWTAKCTATELKEHYEVSELKGNGDGILDPGETISLRMVVLNQSTEYLSNVVATLTTDNEYIEVLQGSTSWAQIGPNEQTKASRAFLS